MFTRGHSPKNPREEEPTRGAQACTAAHIPMFDDSGLHRKNGAPSKRKKRGREFLIRLML